MKLKHTFSRLSIGHYAVAGSLLVHAGFLALFFSWQWELKAPEKKPPNVIKVSFINPPHDPEVSQAQKSSVVAQSAPAQARHLHQVTPVHLKARTAEMTQPDSQPAEAFAQNLQVTRNLGQRPAPQIKDIFQRTMPPATARSMKVTPVRHTRDSQTPRTTAVEQFSSASGGIMARTAYSSPLPQTQSARILARPDPRKIYFSAALQAKTRRSSASGTSTMTVAALPTAIAPTPLNFEDNEKSDVSGLRGMFTGNVRQRIANARVYPQIARRRGMEGQPVIAFTLNKNGQLMELRLDRTSGYQLLDRAALEAVKHAAPYPEIPAPLKLNTFQFKLPISFILK